MNLNFLTQKHIINRGNQPRFKFLIQPFLHLQPKELNSNNLTSMKIHRKTLIQHTIFFPS